MEAFMYSSKRFSSSTQRTRSSHSSACLVFWKIPQLYALAATKLPAGPPGVRMTCVFSARGCFLAANGVVEAGAVVRAHQLAGHVGLVVGDVVPAHHAGRLDLVLLDGVDGELQRVQILLP